MTTSTLPEGCAKARAWLLNEALPLWSTQGYDAAMGRFEERLDFTGRPVVDVPYRLMVQCRQIAVYSHCTVLGWIDARDKIAAAVAHMARAYNGSDSAPGWVFSVDKSGRPLDATRDTYAHAFVLFALGWAYRALADPKLIALADETLRFVDRHLAASSGGLLDQLPRRDELRRQNPHMHFFEAMLSLYEATDRAQYLARAGECFGMLTTRFFDQNSGALLEYFDDGWAPLPSRLVCEPGHHYEWIWLLRRFQLMSGRDTSRYVERLYAHAGEFGHDAEGCVVDEVALTGEVVKASRRSWPHTEAIKAHAIEHEFDRNGCDACAHAVLDVLIDRFLSGPVPGGWVDHFDGKWTPLVDYMPASTLYHVAFAITEACRVFASAASNASGPLR